MIDLKMKYQVQLETTLVYHMRHFPFLAIAYYYNYRGPYYLIFFWYRGPDSKHVCVYLIFIYILLRWIDCVHNIHRGFDQFYLQHLFPHHQMAKKHVKYYVVCLLIYLTVNCICYYYCTKKHSCCVNLSNMMMYIHRLMHSPIQHSKGIQQLCVY